MVTQFSTHEPEQIWVKLDFRPLQNGKPKACCYLSFIGSLDSQVLLQWGSWIGCHVCLTCCRFCFFDWQVMHSVGYEHTTSPSTLLQREEVPLELKLIGRCRFCWFIVLERINSYAHTLHYHHNHHCSNRFYFHALCAVIPLLLSPSANTSTATAGTTFFPRFLLPWSILF